MDVDGDEATGRVYICELRTDAEGTWSEAYGLYRDPTAAATAPGGSPADGTLARPAGPSGTEVFALPEALTRLAQLR